MNISLEDIDTNKLDLDRSYYGITFFIEAALKNEEEITDDMLTWFVSTPPITASASKDEEFLEWQRKKAEEHFRNAPKNLKLVKQLKKEFYDFMCTESERYAKQRELLNGDINVLINSLVTVFSTYVGGLKVGVITSITITLLRIAAKMGKHTLCEVYKPED